MTFKVNTADSGDREMKLPPKRKVYDVMHKTAVGGLIFISAVMAFSFFKDTVKIMFGFNRSLKKPLDDHIVTYEQYKKEIEIKEQEEFERQLRERQKEAESKLS